MEKILMSEILTYDNFDDGLPEEYEFVDSKQTYFDGEKGFANIEAIIRRESDSQFFKVEYTDYGKGENDLMESVGEPVTQKSKTIFYYVTQKSKTIFYYE